MNYSNCPRCNGLISNSRYNCMHCGYIKENLKVCPNCGEVLNNETAVCSTCTYKFNTIKLEFNKLEVGSIIKFGNYKGESIEWLILAVQENKALIITKYVVDCHSFDKNHKFYDVSEIRRFINNTFYNDSFNDIEKDKILTTFVDNSVNSIKHCTDTADKIFLLSLKEVKKYFKTDKDRIAYPSEYAKTNGIYICDNSAVMWWLRNNIENLETDAYLIDDKGMIYDRNTWYPDFGVRPACWIDLREVK